MEAKYFTLGIDAPRIFYIIHHQWVSKKGVCAKGGGGEIGGTDNITHRGGGQENDVPPPELVPHM